MSAQPVLYVSYAWKDREQDAADSREHIVDQFCMACAQRGYTIQRDKTTLGYRDSIEQFMRAIGAGKYVLAVVSDKYLRSEYCMFEAVRMLAHERFEARVFPVVLSAAPVFDAAKALDYKSYWRDKAAAQKLDEAGRDSAAAEWLLKERIYKDIHEHIGEFITRVARLNVLSPAVHLENGFTDIFTALDRQIEKDQPAAPPPPDWVEAPVFPRPEVKKYRFDHCLRPAQTKSVVAKLPNSINLTGEKGQGRHRFMEDLEACGIAGDVAIVRMKLSAFLSDYVAFLRVIARQCIIDSGTADLVDLLRQCAARQNRPVLFLLENPDELYADRPGMDRRFDLGFLQKLNALKNADFGALLLSSYQPVKDLTFRGQSSPLWLEVVTLHALSYDEIRNEVRRRLPDLPENLCAFITEQLEFEPNQTHELLNTLLETLDGRGPVSRDFVGQEIKALRLKLNRR